MPIIDEGKSLNEMLPIMKGKDKFYIASPKGNYKDFRNLKFEESECLTILIGPEGGWSECEEDAFLRHGAELFTLGTNILRVETAAQCALAVARSAFLPYE